MLVQFDAESAGRISKAVQYVEAQYPRTRPLVFGGISSAGQSQSSESNGLTFGDSFFIGGGSSGRKVFQIAVFQGPWNKNESKPVTLLNDEERSVTAANLFANLVSQGTARCAIGRAGTAWYLIAAEC